MELRRKVDWKKKYEFVQNSLDFDLWKHLSDKFGDKSFTYIDGINSLLELGFDKYILAWNRLFDKNTPLNGPVRLYVSKRKTATIELDNFVKRLYHACHSHSAYSFFVLRLCGALQNTSASALLNIVISDYDTDSGTIKNLFTLPKWAKVVIDRQHKLCRQLGFMDTDPLLFVMRYIDSTKVALKARKMSLDDYEIVDALYLFRIKNGFAIYEYISSYAEHIGLKDSAMIISEYGRKTKRTLAENARNKTAKIGMHRKYNKLYNIVAYIFNQKTKQLVRSTIDMGYVLLAVEPGIYLVHGTLGLYKVPWYMLRMPVVRKDREKDKRFKSALHTLGYYDSNYYDKIEKYTQLAEHKIAPRKLQLHEILWHNNNLVQNEEK